ncbi:addiction module antidote protein [uncultured Sutterella sp.]|uniref:addiction module antidote protein n=1 Tax=uncultured Sutterella sp. TaxID=286133 RepID=UPI00262E677D|nr:addiction module antidote protein [uncultured Sutterella sp.]
MCADNRSNSREFPLFAHELNAALKEGDSERFIVLVGGLCRLYGMAEVAKQSGLNRPQLYRSFQKGGNPSFRNLLQCLNVLGIEMTVSGKKDPSGS